ncbi:eCIS core domain-containing protein [Marinigracilibium pacificum]|uniref:DUF4157 domain-containing protein n=1 Tax=Marinigracilibium pacificum TaxID=2729599 RepID=A0A848IZG0_9BACT|nr:DUF4157 domain-containing protein [Marinigracilibium pacificum]NMM49667.1 DUF4157 domain-containing protein [Marinigracilibium pacificum]
MRAFTSENNQNKNLSNQVDMDSGHDRKSNSISNGSVKPSQNLIQPSQEVLPKMNAPIPEPDLQMKCEECEEEEQIQMQPEPQIMKMAGNADDDDDDLIQTKLKIGEPNDEFEKEADAVADQVMRMPEHKVKNQIQTKCSKCEEEENQIQLKAYKSPGNFASPGLTQKLQNSTGGSAMTSDIQKNLGSKMGSDFSGVKIHTDSSAVQMNKELGARAFTYKNNIYFNQGQYNPGTSQGKHLLAHELTHVVQQSGGNNNSIQRSLIRDPADTGGFEPIRSDATTITGLARDGIVVSNHVSAVRTVMVFSQYGLHVFNLSGRRIAQYSAREGEPTISDSIWRLQSGDLQQYGRRDGEYLSERRTIDSSGFSEERQTLINERGFVAFPEDYAETTNVELNSRNYLPAIVVFGQIPTSEDSGDGDSPTLQEWATDQVRELGGVLGVEVNSSGQTSTDSSDQSSLTRDTTADSQRPDRLVPWVREDGEQFVNVWVGGRNREDGGEVVPVQLREGESLEDLQGRVGEATEQARRQLTDRAVREEEELTGGNAAINDSTFLGGTDSDRTANRSAYRASMSGPEVMVRGGTGAYSMRLHYEDVYPDLLGQVSAAFNGSDYVWQVINITPLYQRLMRDRASAIQHMQEQIMRGETPTTPAVAESETGFQEVRQGSDLSSDRVGRFDADFRDLERRYDNFTEDAAQAYYDFTNPIESQDGSPERAVRSVLVNAFNLETLPLHGIMSLGGWVVRVFSSVFGSDPAYEKEIPFPSENGYYMVRCVAQPRVIGDEDDENAIIRMPSLATKVVEVKNIQERTREELDAQDQNLQAMILELLLSFRATTDERQLADIRRALELKVQEAAQSNRSFLDEQISRRESTLEDEELTEEQRDKVNQELTILRQGTAAGAGLLSDIIERQLAIKREQLTRETNSYRRRDIERDIRNLERRVETARARESEMRVGGTSIVRPQAVFVNEENGQTYPLLIEIGQSRDHSPTRGYTMRVSDITGTDSDQHDAIGDTQREAVIHAIEEYAGHFPYGRGYVTVRFPAGQNFGITEPIVRRCNPRDTAQASERLDELIQILSVVGLFIPGVGVAVAAVGAAVSAVRILSRINNHTFAWDTNTISDILNIVGAVASGVSRLAGARLVRARNLFAVVPESEDFAQWFTRLSRFQRAVDFVDSTVNNVSYLIGTMEIVHNFMEIQQQVISGRMTHAEARRRRAQLLTQAMFDGFLQHVGDALSEHRAEGGESHHGDDTPPPHGHGDDTPPHHTDDSPPHHTEDSPPPHHEEGRRDSDSEDGTPHPHEEEGRRRTEPPTPHTDVDIPSDPVSRLRAFLAIRANRTALLAGDPHTTKRLLETFGNWRDLIMHLQSEPANDMYAYLVDHLGSYRDGVVQDIGQQFSLQLSDPNASTHASSDVDLATGGTDAGRRLTLAEAYMREHFGANWSELLRMNFYTQAERLFIYEQVRNLMSPAEFGAFQGRVTEMAEVLNFAKMMQHAQGSPESVARVEGLMSHLSPEQQAAVRSLAAESPGDAQIRLAVLHGDIDTLHSRFEALQSHTGEGIPPDATGVLPPTLPPHLRTAIEGALTPQELQVALAQAITELQMQANFRTEEAYISPGAGRQVVRGVAVTGHEAYQSALANLEMMEHVMHQAGGDVEVAIREYEMYKYIFRFITAMQLSGVRVDSFMLAYYQAAYDIYRQSRTSLQGVGRSDLSFVRAMHDQFLAQAREALPQMRSAADQGPTEWNPTHRSLEADDTHIRDLDAERRSGESGGGASGPAGERGALTVGQLLSGRSGLASIAHVPIRRNPSLSGNETRARFEGGRLVLELGPSAGHTHVGDHIDTLRVLQRYEGAFGLIRRLTSRIGELLGWGPGFGSRGEEARLEVDKLLGIRSQLEVQRDVIEAAMRIDLDGQTLEILEQNYNEMERQIAEIESQIQHHEAEVDSTARGLGHVAMSDTTRVLTESDPEFRQQPGVGESWRYRDRGGTEGTVSRLTHDTLAIVTALGQTTTRANYQSWLRPGQVGLPSGRRGFEALHAIGPGVGHESPFGILMGPWRVNQLIQRLGIENFLATAGRNIVPGQQLFLRVEVERVTMPVTQSDGSVIQVDFLKRITYQIYGDSVGPGNRLFSLELSVNEPNNPLSEVSFDQSAVEIDGSLGQYTDVDALAGILNPEFNSTDPIDE